LNPIERRSQLLVIVAAFALACASTPESVERTRESLRAAEADPAVTRGASIELDQARKAVDRLEDAADDGDVSEEELDHLAYVAEQKIRIARIAATEDEIRRQVGELTEKREALKLRGRGAQAERAKAHDAGRAQPQEIEIQVETVE
jgi:OOP family OmpA-OmpF porin